MGELLARVCALFVMPAAPSPAVAARFAPAPSVALLCAPRDALPAGAALALALARASGSSRALVCLWRARPPEAVAWRAPAPRASRQLVASLAAHGFDAQASGRLVRVTLPEDAAPAAAAAARAGAVAAAPVVVALAGPRTAALDRMLAAQDLVVVVRSPRGDAVLAELACESVAELGVRTVACKLSIGTRARVLAAAGIAAPAALRSALEPALEAVR
jgi:hypothetical protein